MSLGTHHLTSRGAGSFLKKEKTCLTWWVKRNLHPVNSVYRGNAKKNWRLKKKLDATPTFSPPPEVKWCVPFSDNIVLIAYFCYETKTKINNQIPTEPRYLFVFVSYRHVNARRSNLHFCHFCSRNHFMLKFFGVFYCV